VKTAVGVAVVAVGMALALSGCGGSADTESSAGEDGAAAPAQILVAAASDLRVAFEELGAAFAKETGTEVTFTFGSSGQLAQQIANGAPFDLFASADVGYVDDVIDAGRGDAETKRTYAFGHIVIWSRDRSYPDLAAVAADEALTKLAIANPEHAPYGVAAEQALERAGVYDDVARRLVFGENISDTLRLAQSGNADAAIVALSLAITSDGEWTPIPEGLHEPLEQALVVTAESDEQARLARAFADFVSSAEGREVMRRYGFLLPGDDAPAEAAGG
jgi:molybdate transport system substrate-binding protein